MDLRLHLLETFSAVGSDGCRYKVRAYERMLPDLSLSDSWQSTGIIEYRLEDGRLIDARPDGTLQVVGSGVTLTSTRAATAA